MHAPSRPRRWPLLLLALSGLLLLLAGAAWALLQSGAVRAAVLARVVPRLEARLGPVEVGDTWRVGWRGGVTLGPLTVRAGATAPQPPLLRVERVRVLPRLSALLAGRLEVREVVLSGVRVEAGRRAERLRALLAREQDGPAGADGTGARADAAPLPRLRVEEAVVALGEGAPATVGPFSGVVEVQRQQGGLTLSAEGTLGGGTVHLQASSGAGAAGPTLSARWASLPAGPLLAPLVPLQVEGGHLSGELQHGDGDTRLKVSLAGLTLRGEKLAEAPVGPLFLTAEAQAQVDVSARTATLTRARLTLGEEGALAVEATGSLALSAQPTVSLKATLLPVSYPSLLAALPAALVPGEEVAGLEGPLRGTLEVAGPLRQPETWEVKGRLVLSELKARDAPALTRLQGPFDYRPLVDEEARGRRVRVGPDNPFFVPLEAVPPVLVRAVLLSEDSFFFAHQGFDFPALVHNLAAPREEGEVVRGGSTLTQQLAKNLFLSREKTYARKVREALLTLALEAALSKERLLEVYLNIIEWGPGLYGLGEAAQHYFAKDARALTLEEAVFLATIIPNPVRYHVYCSRGALSEVWQQRVEELLVKLHGAGDVSEAELAAARARPLLFHHPAPDEPVQGAR